MKYTAYTANQDGSINVLAGSTNSAVFDKILPTGTEYSVHDGETYTAGGKTWLSETDEGYIEAKAREKKDKALAELDSQFRIDRATIMEYYTQAVFDGDTETQEELKEEMEEIKTTYAEERKALEEE
jgi:hypothetical protein